MLSKEGDLYSNSWYHPAPHDYESGKYISTVFSTVDELIDYVKKHLVE